MNMNFKKYFFLFFGFIITSFGIYGQVKSPNNINGLQLWLRADSGVTTSGGFVQTWNDVSGNGYNCRQDTANYQPQFVSNAINGQPAIQFNGTHNVLWGTSISNIDSTSITILVFANGLPQSHLITGFFEINSYANGFSFGRHLISGYEYLALYNKGANIGTPDHTLPNTGFNYTILGGIKIFGSNSTLYLNGVQQGLTAKSGNPSTSAAQNSYFTNGNYKIGYFQGFDYLNGNIAEVIIFNRALPQLERQSVENYLRLKYIPSTYRPPLSLGNDTTQTYSLAPITIAVPYQSYYQSYLWNTGATASSIAANVSGAYSVIVTDERGYIYVDTINVTKPKVTLHDTISCGNAIVLDSKLSGAYLYNWSTGATTQSIIATLPGNYSVTVTDTNNFNVSSNSASITIDNFSSTASLGNDTAFCAGNELYLKKGYVTSNTYVWSNGSTNDSLPVFSSGQYWVTATNINGCVKKDTINVSVSGVAPTASFLFDTVCFGNANHFKDLSSPLPSINSIAARHWDFGDMITLDTTATSFTHTFADTGVYSVKLTITTNVGCSAEKTKQIHVYPYPVISYSVTNLCENAVVSFKSTASTFSYPIANWNWNFGDPSSGINNISSLQNTTHNFSVYGSYNVQLIAKNAYGCSDIVKNNLFINPSPSINFGYSLACVNNVVQFTDLTPASPLFNVQSYYWDFNDLVTSSLQNPIHAFSNSTTYNVKHIISADNGCVDSLTIALFVHPKPMPAFTYSNACVNNTTVFSDNSSITTGSINNWKWNFGDNGSSAIQNPKHNYSDTLSARVKLVSTSNIGCKDSLTQTVYIRPSPTADFSVNPPYGSPPLLVSFINNSSGASYYFWNIGSTTSTNTSPQYTFTSIGNYSVTLTASTNSGCVSTQSKTVDITAQKIDVAIQNLSAGIQNNYLTISAQFLNNSSMDITSLDLNIQVDGVAQIKQSWTGLLVKGGLLAYTIPSSIYIDNAEHFVCVSVENPNGLQDEVPENDESCKAINETTFQVLSVYPNPTFDKLTIPIFIPETNSLSIILYDLLGQKKQDVYSGNINKGLQLQTVDFTGIAKGIYLLKFEYGGTVIVKKFIKD